MGKNEKFIWFRKMRLRKAILLFLLVTLPFSLINPISSSNSGITELDLNPIDNTNVYSESSTYTKPDKSTIAKTVATDSEGNFTDTNTPDVEGVWSANAAWNGAERYKASSSTELFAVTKNERDNWAIIVGVSDYKDINDLYYTDDDAIELYNKLRELCPKITLSSWLMKTQPNPT